MISTTPAGSVEFDALVISLGPDYPIRIVSWKYKGKTDWEWYNHFYQPCETDGVFWRDYILKDESTQKEADDITGICNWIDTHIHDIINRDDDQSHLAEDDRWDQGIFACRVKLEGFLTSTWDYTNEYDEDSSFEQIVHITDMLDWDKHLDRPDLAQKG